MVVCLKGGFSDYSGDAAHKVITQILVMWKEEEKGSGVIVIPLSIELTCSVIPGLVRDTGRSAPPPSRPISAGSRLSSTRLR